MSSSKGPLPTPCAPSCARGDGELMQDADAHASKARSLPLRDGGGWKLSVRFGELAIAVEESNGARRGCIGAVGVPGRDVSRRGGVAPVWKWGEAGSPEAASVSRNSTQSLENDYARHARIYQFGACIWCRGSNTHFCLVRLLKLWWATLLRRSTRE